MGKSKKPYRERRLTKKHKAHAMKVARKLPPYMHYIAFSLASNRVKPKFGRMGPASEVREVSEDEAAEIRRRYETEARGKSGGKG